MTESTMNPSPPVARITERFFWTEDHPIVGLVQSMYDHTQAAQSELNKLAKSLGANEGVFHQGRPLGFVYEDITKAARCLKPTTARKSGFIVFEPKKMTDRAVEVRSQMNKLSIPNYSDAPYTLGLFRYNTFRSSDYINRVWLGFTRDGNVIKRVFVVVPFWALGHPLPEVKIAVQPGTAYDTPEPEGWTEWSRAAQIQFVEEAKERANG